MTSPFRRAKGTLFANLASLLTRGLNIVLLCGTVETSTSARCHVEARRPVQKADGWRKAERAINKVARFLGAGEEHCRRAYEADLKQSRQVVEQEDNYQAKMPSKWR